MAQIDLLSSSAETSKSAPEVRSVGEESELDRAVEQIEKKREKLIARTNTSETERIELNIERKLPEEVALIYPVTKTNTGNYRAYILHFNEHSKTVSLRELASCAWQEKEQYLLCEFNQNGDLIAYELKDARTEKGNTGNVMVNVERLTGNRKNQKIIEEAKKRWNNYESVKSPTVKQNNL